MKIAQIIIGLNVGGAELMLKRLIESHRNKPDVEHIVISLTGPGVIGVNLAQLGIEVHCLDMTSFAKGPATFFKLRKLLKQVRPDIVHTWMYHADLLGGLAAYSLGMNHLIWCVRSTDISMGGSKVTLLIRKLCALLSQYLPKVVVCGANASRLAHVAIGYAPDKMQVIPNGFDLNKLMATERTRNSIRNALELGPECKAVISVGRFNPVKDHKSFIEAAGQVAAQRDDVRFILVGRGLDSSNQELISLIDATGKPNVFHLLGERKDVPDYLRGSDVFCLHSVTEGFPNALGEAMAVSLPCVVTDVGDAAYLLNNSQWVVPPAAPDMLAEKLLAMLSLTEIERARLGKAAATRIRENFTMELISHRYYDLYKSFFNPPIKLHGNDRGLRP